MWTLRNPQTGQAHPIPESGLRIGRAVGNDLVLADDEVSRYHATVWLHGGQAYIRDENSTNGTWVNEQRITAPTPLRPGDRVRLGKTVLEVTAGAPEATVISDQQEVYRLPVALSPLPVAPSRAARSPLLLWILAGSGVLFLCSVLIIVAVLGRGRWAGLSPATPPTPASTFTPGAAATSELMPVPEPTRVPTSVPTRTPTRSPTRTPTSTPTPPPCLPDVAFVADVTVPDGTQFAPGASFTKTWRVRSSGCRAWEPGSRWVFVSGDRMGAPDGVDVAPARPGETVDISVPMQAPTASGTYKGFWQMRGPDGRFFGERVYVMIVVAPPTPTTDTRPTVSVTIINDTGGTLTLSLSGPATYHFTFAPGRHVIRVIPGTYSYTAWGCGGARDSGTYDLSEGDEWRFWCQTVP